MKIERNKLSHWIMLIISGIYIIFSVPFRILKPRNTKRIVFFYQMHGNNQALMEYIKKHDSSIDMYFLAFPKYLKIYRGKHELPTLNMLNPIDMIRVAKSDVVITNYGALTLQYLAKWTSLKFVDVWHGLPMLKNQTPKIMDYLNDYDEVWLSSPDMKEFYQTRYQLRSRLEVTGYGRVDKLVTDSYDRNKVCEKYQLPLDKKIILIAPTWKHNNPNRNELPFGLSSTEFIKELGLLVDETNSHVVFRAHMLSVDIKGIEGSITALSSHDFPDTEEIISVADMVVTDWSSIAFDFMTTDRPVIFIDGQPPFVGEELKTRCTPSNRFGPVVGDIETFKEIVTRYLENPSLYHVENGNSINKVKQIAYGDTLDGNSTERYYNRLIALLES
jgi:CDP-glycerol glycerophosphotransferase (TagB/SpsB family)